MREIISTRASGAPMGAYSQAIKVGNLVWTSGAGPLDSDTGELLYPNDIAKQTVKTLENLEEILQAAGTSLEHAVRVGVFLRDIAEWGAFNDAYKAFFPNDPPARTTVGAGGLPVKDMCVEIEVVAVVPDA
jgi:2-iminobutanoate/2-iminopropanoate deaminase